MKIKLSEVLKDEKGNPVNAFKQFVLADNATKKVLFDDKGQPLMYSYIDKAEETTIVLR
jgi:hypothetical protein